MKTDLALFIFAAVTLHGAPFLPANDNMVLEKLPRGLKPIHRTQELGPSCQQAREFIQLARETSEPRYLGYAQGVLSTWINEVKPPTDVLFLRATIRQSNHQFAPAIQDLDALLVLEPRNKAALITKLTVLQAQGQIREARALCQKSTALAGDIVGLATITSITSLNGQLGQSFRTLKTFLDRDGAPSAFAWTTLAEMAVRMGDQEEAEKAFKRSLTFAENDIYLLAAYADFLIDCDRNSEVITLLENKTNSDSLLLRLALAQKSASPELQRRLEATRSAVGFLHAREEAMFTLHLLHNPAAALQLALENWKNQREPLDARILLECAAAVNDRAAAKPVIEWIDSIQLEDARLKLLLEELR